MLKRPHYIALGVMLLLTLGLLKLPRKVATNLRLAISGMFLPLYGLSGSAEDLAVRSSYGAVPRGELIRQLEQYDRERSDQRMRAVQAAEVLRENARLRELLGSSKQFPWNKKLARVVSRDPANWWHGLKIDLGARDGVRTNTTVFTAEGLVGRVSEVGYAMSHVVLVGDPDCRVAVLVGDDRAREQGMIVPASSSPLDNTLVELSFLSRNARLTAGMHVYTSGMGGVFPKGLLVGQVADFRTVGYGLYTEAMVRLAVKQNQLEEVWVMMP